MNDELKYLVEKYVELVESEENKSRNQYWEPEPVYCKDRFRRIAKPWKVTGKIPVTLQLSVSLRAKQFDFSLKKFYQDPETFIINYLKIMIAQFELNDSITLDKVIPYWPGTSFESSMFGMGTVYTDLEDPALSVEPVIKEYSDLEKLKMPDFFESGLMPEMHRIYNDVNDLLKGSGCKMAFVEMLRSPFGMAFQMRGFQNLAMDLTDDPAWVHELMRFLTEAHKKWYTDRANFLCEKIPLVHLYNDEVDCNLYGPHMYEKFVLDYEIELSRFHGGTAYWHSCGNITPILEQIKRIPDLKLLNIGPWTDYRKAAKICPDIPLEIVANSVDDVYMADEKKMSERAKDILAACMENNVRAFYLSTSMLTPFLGSTASDLAKGEQWLNITKEGLVL